MGQTGVVMDQGTHLADQELGPIPMSTSPPSLTPLSRGVVGERVGSRTGVADLSQPVEGGGQGRKSTTIK